jgi:putative ABC transport system permease protein
MVIKADIEEALKSLSTARQRSLLALIGIVIGIGSVIGMISIGTIVEHRALQQFKDMGIDVVTVRTDWEGGATKGGFRINDILDLKHHGTMVSQVAPYLLSSDRLRYKGKTQDINLIAVTESFFDVTRLTATTGRLITNLDEGRYFCVLGYDLARVLGGPDFNHMIGKDFAFGRRIYTVVGVLNKAPDGGMRPDGINTGVITHISVGLRAFNDREIAVFLARVNTSDTPTIKAYMGEYFAKRAGLRITVVTAEELISNMQKQMQLFTILLGAIGSISLIVGGIGVMNVMLVAVTERRKEIGIRRALGAQRDDIQGQFIAEAIALCLAGAVLGIILGVGGSFVFSYFTKWEFMVSGLAILLGVGVATVVGVFFGFYPAHTASRLDPIEALRSSE